MSNISIKRALVNTQSTFTADLGTNPPTVVGDNIYVPVTIALAQTDISAVGSTLTATNTFIQGAAAAFDKVRVGDFVTAVTTGTLTPKAVLNRVGLYGVTGQSYLVYPDSYTAGTLGIKSGDLIAEETAGLAIPALTFVKKIDHATRRIFLSAALIETGLVNVDVTPRIRVTAVRTSTAVTNPNQIDIDSTVATNGAASTVTIKGGAVDGVLTVLKLTPVDSTTTGVGTIAIGGAQLTGSLVVGTDTGINNIPDDSTLTYITLGSYTTNIDTFLLNAGVVAPVS